MKNQFSIVIPTMWLSKKLLLMLHVYEKSPFVREVIIIDNAPAGKPDLSPFKKVRYYTRGYNIFVNPAWNWGASLANYQLIFANDDIVVIDFNQVMKLISETTFDIVGIHTGRSYDEYFPVIDNFEIIYSNEKITVVNFNGHTSTITPESFDIVGLNFRRHISSPKIEAIETFPSKGYGCFMYVRNFYYIPEQFLIWYGDNFLFEFSPRRAILKNINVIAEKSTTVDSSPEFRSVICRNSTLLFNSMLKLTDTDFNIIIRTAGRPNYFENCIESIRTHYPSAKLHIILDTPSDFDYVNAHVYGFNFNYYFVNQDTVRNFCDRITIKRPQFIYNFYFNIVKPFLKGWCLFLDDDDQLLMHPVFKHKIKNIYIFKVKIGERIVPSEKNFGNQPVLNDISGLSILFHSSQMVDWTPQRGGDFEFINAMYQKCNPVWIDAVISSPQTEGNFGKRNDIGKQIHKIAVCIPMWKRPAVTNFVFNYYRNLQKQLSGEVELILIACGSEGSVSRRLAEKNGFVYVEYPNGALAQKHNAIYLKAKEYYPDACLKIDSDSIVSIEFFRYYNQLITDGYDYSGITDIYFLVNGHLCYWSGYTNHRTGEPTGVGRFLSRQLLNMFGWRPWGNSPDQFVDRVLTANIAPLRNDIRITQTSCRELGAMCIDIRSNEQLTGFAEFIFDEVIKLNNLKVEYLGILVKKQIKNTIDFSPLENELLKCDRSTLRVNEK